MNCPKFLAIAAIAATAVFATNQASAVMGAVNISATGTFELDTVVSPGNDTFKTASQSFRNTDALLMLQTAVGNAFPDEDVSYFTTKGAELVYDPDAFNAEASAEYTNNVFGIFWVTNTTTHQGFRLDGPSEFGYFSFVELDFAPWFLGTSSDGYLNLNGVSSGKYIASPYQYSDKITGNATFYIHDNPYDFDYPDNLGSVVFDNDFAVVLTGTTTYSFSYKFDSKSGTYIANISLSIKGSGDGIWNNGGLVDQGYLPQAVFSGSVSHKDSGKESADVALLPDPLGSE